MISSRLLAVRGGSQGSAELSSVASGCNVGIIGNNGAIIVKVNYREGTEGGREAAQEERMKNGGIEISHRASESPRSRKRRAMQKQS